MDPLSIVKLLSIILIITGIALYCSFKAWVITAKRLKIAQQTIAEYNARLKKSNKQLEEKLNEKH